MPKRNNPVVRTASNDEQRRALVLTLARLDAEMGATHECEEWRDFYEDRRCAICGRAEGS